MTGRPGTSGSPCSQGNSIRAIFDEKRTDRFPDSEASKVSYRHSRGFNAIYGDGHCKWNRWGSTKVSAWSIQAD